MKLRDALDTGKDILGIWGLVAVVTIGCIIASPLIILAFGLLFVILLILGFTGLMTSQGGWIAIAAAIAFVGWLTVEKLL